MDWKCACQYGNHGLENWLRKLAGRGDVGSTILCLKPFGVTLGINPEFAEEIP